MSEIIEKVALAILNEQSDGLGPNTQARAAINTVREWFEAEAKRNSWDEHEMLMAAATLKAALDTPSQITPHGAGS